MSGTPRVGAPLTATLGSWVGLGRPHAGGDQGFVLQWRRCDGSGGGCVDIANASLTTIAPSQTSTYTPTAADLGSTLRVRVRASTGFGTSVVADSAAVGPVGDGGTPAPAAVTELAPDAGFELDPTASYFTHGSAAFTWATDQSHSATHALKIVSTQPAGTMSRWLSNTTAVPAVPGKTYELSAWLKTAGVQQANVSLDFWDASGNYLGVTVDSQPLSGTVDWTRATLRATAPANAAFVRIELRLFGQGTLWADDASLTAP